MSPGSVRAMAVEESSGKFSIGGQAFEREMQASWTSYPLELEA